jgi:Zn-dependent protease
MRGYEKIGRNHVIDLCLPLRTLMQGGESSIVEMRQRHEDAMNDQAFFEWLAFGYLMLLGIRYLLGARVYLLCALREAELRAANPEELDPEELQLISLFDEDLAAAGFRHLGFGLISPIITYYESASAASIFANETLPAYALVQRRVAPEYGGLAHLEVVTEFSSGPALVTQNTAYARAFLPAGISVEALREASVSEVVGRHADRVTQAAESRVPLRPDSLRHILGAFGRRLAGLRVLYRRRRWVTATTDRLLDRFTLLGALTLAHHSMRYFGKPASLAQRRAEAVPEALRALRVQADFKAVKHIAETAQPAPGTPWALITAIIVTALASFAAMATLWGPFTASVILAVVAFHEAGHVVAMRVLGYRDIHVLFVPLLGALTVAGRAAKTTALQRVAVLLAGPVPGLCLGVLLLEINRMALAMPDLKVVALALLLINGLNLLPITPFDGGRALEALVRPASLWRPAIHVMSIVGLLAAAYRMQDPVLAVIAVAWAPMLRRQVLGWRLRRSVTSAVRDSQGVDEMIRGALRCMTEPRFSSWRSATRQATARALAREFSETGTPPSDRRWAAVAYAAAWIPAIAGAILWWR